MRGLAWVTAACLALTGACASTVDGTNSSALDGGLTDVPPGVNPDGLDPFRPIDAGPIVVDGGSDTGTWQVPDGPVFDQRYGYLYVGSLYDSAQELSYVSAEFRLVPRADDPRCSVLAEGRWDIQRCTLDGGSVPDTHPRPFPNAGVIQFLGGRQTVRLTPGSQGTYNPFYVQQQTIFPGPLTLQVQAAGGQGVPAFNLAVQIPPPVNDVVPAPVAGAPLVIDRSADFTLRWAPIGARAVWLTLTVPQDSNDRGEWFRVNVDYDGSSGEGSLPRRALQSLPSTRAGRTAVLTVLPYNISTTRVGPWPLQVTAVGQGARFEVVLR